MEYKYHSEGAKQHANVVLERIGDNPSSSVEKKAKAFFNALKNADASVSAFEIVLDGWNGTETVEQYLKNELLDFDGRFVGKDRVDLVLRVIEIKYDFPEDSYSKQALIQLANDLKTVTHRHNNLMAALGVIELPEEVNE